MDVNTRNQIVMNYHKNVERTIRKNYPLLKALGIEKDDAYQELMITVIKSIDGFDPSKCDNIEKHINARLKFRVLKFKESWKPHGMVGKEARDLTYCSLNQPKPSGAQMDMGNAADHYLTELADAFSTLGGSEINAIRKSTAGHVVRTDSERDCLRSGRTKLHTYFQQDGGELACC